MTPLSPLATPRDGKAMLERTRREWDGHSDLWIFGYGSLIWRPDFDYAERRPARVHGWHRALQMWSHINRGTPECPGLVLAMLRGGSCRGVVFRVHKHEAAQVLEQLWQREMKAAVYDPRWLRCHTDRGPVQALAFTLSHHSPHYTGALSPQQYRHIFARAQGIYGTTADYAQATVQALQQWGIRDHALERIVAQANPLDCGHNGRPTQS